MRLSRPTLTSVFVVLFAATAGAQPATPPTSAAPLLPYIQSVSVNPLAIPFGLFSAEYEAALPTPGFTIGVGGSYFANGDRRDAWAEVKGLYYPNESAFRGFSVGLSGGVHSARDNTSSCAPFTGICTNGRKTQTAPTLGVLASYDWLLGRQERFRVGVGVGAKRTLRQVRSSDPLLQVFPDGRFVIGVVF